MAETMAMADNTTRAMDMEDTNRLTLKKDTIIEGKKEQYEISINDYIGAGGESKVYLATRVSDKEKVVAKIYDTFTDDPVKKKNRKNVINFLNENNDYKKSHIMPLLDEGMIYLESNDGDDQFLRPVDIIPYCKDGELKQCDYNMLKNKVIPEILIALKTLHESNLVHRDIKPDNIYTYNGEIVLADFGTTSQILNISDYGKTETKRGTPGFTAPEISDKYFIIESDYYSFGCTIASLYKGKHVYQTLIDQKKFVDINIAMRREGLPLDCPETEADLQALVNSLVMPDSAMRANYDGVSLWLKNSGSFVASWKDKLKQGYETISTGFKFKDRTCNNRAELTDAILNDWEYAKQLLYKGGEKNSAIVNYLSKEDQNLSLKAIEIIEENKDTVNNQDLGLARFLHFFNTNDDKPCPIYWCGKPYNNLEEISNEISSNKADEKSIIKMLEDKFLSWKFTNTKGVSEDTIAAIKEIEEIKADYPHLGYFTFMYKFAPKKNRINTSADKIFKELTETKEDWNKTAEKSIKDDKLLANLVSLGYKKNVFTLKKGCIGKFISEDGISDLLLFYQLFEGICEDKEYVREHYLKYGPQANIYESMLKTNTDSFVLKNAKDKIDSLIINPKISINDLNSAFVSFKQYMKDEEQERIEKLKQYEQLLKEKQRAVSEDDFKEIAKKFRAMNGYKDSEKLSIEYEKKYNKIIKKRRYQKTVRILVVAAMIFSVFVYGMYIGWFAPVFKRHQSVPDTVTVIKNGKYAGNLLTSVVIPASVTSIGNRAFSRNGLTSVVIPDSVTSIGKGAFSRNKLTSVVIPDSVTSIGDKAFANNKLTQITIGANVKIGKGAFNYGFETFYNNNGMIAGIYTLSNIKSNDWISWHGDYKFQYQNGNISLIEYNGDGGDIEIPAEISGYPVTTIGDEAFIGRQLTSVNIPNSVISIGNDAFSNNRLSSVTIPNSVTEIGARAFLGNQLTSVNIGNSVVSIGNGAFSNNRLSSVNIPNSVTVIGDQVFYGNQLTNVSIPNSVISIGNDAFSNNRLSSVTIPNSVTSIGNGAFSNNRLTSITIPNSVTSIGNSAFSNNRLTSVSIPNSVTEIRFLAFSRNQLTSVRIGANVTGRYMQLLEHDTGFDNAYFKNKNQAGTYTRPNAKSTTWTRR